MTVAARWSRTKTSSRLASFCGSFQHGEREWATETDGSSARPSSGKSAAMDPAALAPVLDAHQSLAQLAIFILAGVFKATIRRDPRRTPPDHTARPRSP